MEPVTFEQRVIDIATAEARKYQSVYVDWEYLICSDAFVQKEYYIIDAKQDDYQHLIGVNALISPQAFFSKMSFLFFDASGL